MARPSGTALRDMVFVLLVTANPCTFGSPWELPLSSRRSYWRLPDLAVGMWMFSECSLVAR